MPAERDDDTTDGTQDVDTAIAGVRAMGEGKDASALVEFAVRIVRDNFAVRHRGRDKDRKIAELSEKVTAAEQQLTAAAPLVKLASERKLTAEQLAAQLTAGDALATENAALKQSQTVRDAAEVLGWKPAILAKLAKMEALDIRLTEGEGEDAPPVPVVVRLTDDEEEETTPLSAYVTQHLAEFADVLPVSEAERATSGRREPPVPGTRLPRQRSGDEGAKRGESKEQLVAQARKSGLYRF